MKDVGSIRPKKSLSQNFLTDVGIAQRIAQSIEPQEAETLIEIGPGTGALTTHLCTITNDLRCVELDDRAIVNLGNRFQKEIAAGSMTLIHGDVLDVDFSSFANAGVHKLSIIGNIPYAISSPILFRIFDNASMFRRAVIMMQKEVALRLVAKTGTKEYGVLTLAAQMVCSPKILFDVKPGSFFPRPSVTSSVVRLDMHAELPDAEEMSELRLLIRAAFGQRRKTLRNALEQLAQQHYGVALRSMTFPWLNQRAEELNLTQFKSLRDDLQQESARV